MIVGGTLINPPKNKSSLISMKFGDPIGNLFNFNQKKFHKKKNDQKCPVFHVKSEFLAFLAFYSKFTSKMPAKHIVSARTKSDNHWQCYL